MAIRQDFDESILEHIDEVLEAKIGPSIAFDVDSLHYHGVNAFYGVLDLPFFSQISLDL